MYHRIVEAFKWGYGQRSKLGDPSDVNITQEVNSVMNLYLKTHQHYNQFFPPKCFSWYQA